MYYNIINTKVSLLDFGDGVKATFSRKKLNFNASEAVVGNFAIVKLDNIELTNRK